MKKILFVFIMVLMSSCATLMSPGSPHLTNRQYEQMDRQGTIDGRCYMSATRTGALLVDIFLLGLVPIIIDVATDNLTYYEYVGCQSNRNSWEEDKWNSSPKKSKKRRSKRDYEDYEDEYEDDE